MASKFGLAGGIPERRVRPIWDAVDSRQYKAALKLCTALLAKHPTSPYVLVSGPLPSPSLARFVSGVALVAVLMNLARQWARSVVV
jgi:hypothetical protein